jgi:hypothetical protein
MGITVVEARLAAHVLAGQVTVFGVDRARTRTLDWIITVPPLQLYRAAQRSIVRRSIGVAIVLIVA